MSFSALGLSPKVVNAVTAAGFSTPTPIQAGAIPPAVERRDVLGLAQTGSGKTAAFVLPMLTLLEKGRARARMPRTLVLEPTRELAAQVQGAFESLGRNHRLTVALLIGGVSFDDQAVKIERICKLLPFTRQTLFFSATMPSEIQRLTSQFLHNPERIEAAPPATTAASIEQYVLHAPHDPKQKRAALRDVLR